jgi:DNA-binding MarR family transcriptional regulator
MNNIDHSPPDDLIRYQTARLEDLISEVIQCCQARTAYLSKKFDIPQAELRCLMLFEGEKYLTVKGIAQKLDVAKSRVTKIVEGLLQKNLLNRIDDPGDARVRLLSLNPAGHRKSEEISAFNKDLHQQLLLELGSEERKSVLSSLEVLRGSMEAIKCRLV